mmetsp:Transcript_1287/g.1734  ORF Transcript_1287/g.1734 Transcript_1287/m.1734 type:complete len:181 (+) Transcript_1287:276-818(+)
MHYGLAHLESSFHAYNVYKVVSLAPCFVPHVPNFTKAYANSTIMQFQSKGVFAINGPNCEQDLKTICANFPGIFCDFYRRNTGEQGQSVKSEQHWVMNSLTDRFQEFAPDWLDGQETMPLVDVSQIKQVPMAFFTATRDQVCPIAWQASTSRRSSLRRCRLMWRARVTSGSTQVPTPIGS